MHESVAIVYYNPFAIGVTVIVIGFRVAVFKYIVAHTVCYGAYLRGRASLGNYEFGRGCRFDVTHINDGDAAPLALLYPVDYKLLYVCVLSHLFFVCRLCDAKCITVGVFIIQSYVFFANG